MSNFSNGNGSASINDGHITFYIPIYSRGDAEEAVKDYSGLLNASIPGFTKVELETAGSESKVNSVYAVKRYKNESAMNNNGAEIETTKATLSQVSESHCKFDAVRSDGLKYYIAVSIGDHEGREHLIVERARLIPSTLKYAWLCCCFGCACCCCCCGCCFGFVFGYLFFNVEPWSTMKSLNRHLRKHRFSKPPGQQEV